MILPPVGQKSGHGLSYTATLAEDAIEVLSQIDDANKKITDADMNTKAAGYAELMDIENSAEYQALSETGPETSEFFNGLITHVDAYLSSIEVYVPNPSGTNTHPDDLPLQYKGHTATAKDIVDAINSNDTSQDFSFHSRLHNENAKDTDWISKHDIDNAAPRGSWHTSDKNGGISYKVNNVDVDPFQRPQTSVDAKGSAESWSNYAVGVSTDDSAYQDLMSYLGD